MPDQWMDQATEIRDGEELPIARLEAFLLSQIPDTQGPLVVEQFPSGFSNLTYLLRLGAQQLVLRRPPFGANIKSGHDMSREYRILSGLIQTYSKVPRPLLYSEDESLIGAPFYVMERVEGVILRPKMPKAMHPSAQQMRGIAEALVNTFVELHQTDYQAAGLGELGRPEGYITRQIGGWTKRYLKAKTDEIPEMENVAQWLADHLPQEQAPSLIHNDFKYDNIVLDAQDWTRVIAVLDWEMATIGDPLMDLGTSIGYWVDPDDPPIMSQLRLSPTTLAGNPTRSEIVQMYAQKSGRDLDQVVFYYAYGLFKIGVIVQQIYARYKKGLTKDPRFAALIHAVKACAQMASRATELNRIDRLL
ncbi:MAG: phosphotransferase family protein [Bacteroidota bacterium]